MVLRRILRENVIVFKMFSHVLDLIQSEDVHQHIPLTTVEHGGTVTVQCAISGVYQMIYWYKQTLGQMPQMLAFKSLNEPKSTVLKNYMRFSTEIVNENSVLKIKNITNLDEGIYFCQTGNMYGTHFRNGTFVTVKGTYPTVDKC